MQEILSGAILLIWLIGAWYRTYRQARFYQIEEYKSGRYVRWLFGERDRWLPSRPMGAAFVGLVLSFVTDIVPGAINVPAYILGITAATVGVMAPNEGEIKKPFVRTQRATRLLAAAFIIASIVCLLCYFAVQGLASDSQRLPIIIPMIVGLLIFLLAPLWLIAGNIAMMPVESLLRQRYIQSARGVMATIQPTVIGITGSYGKTTTKNFIRDIMNARYRTYATPKSYNTLMGICIAINQDLADDYSVEYFVSEMGAYVPGEIARICDLTPPRISVVVEVGPQHLERFGTLENVATAKYEIIKALPPDGTGIFNWDNPYVRKMYERGYPQNQIAVSKSFDPNSTEDGPRIVAENIEESLHGLAFDVIDRETGDRAYYVTTVVGLHNVTNLLLATAVAISEGMTLAEVAQRVKTLQPAESRLVRQVTDAGITIINDAYSANPVGVQSALSVLRMHDTGRRVLITPGMIELAELHDAENYKLGQQAASAATDVLLVGERQTAPIARGLRDAYFPEDRLHIVETLSEAVDWYTMQLAAGDTVLFLNDLPDTY